MAKESWFNISNSADLEPRNEGGRVARVDIMGPIGGWDVSGAQFLRELKDLGDDISEIDLRVHSPGGSILDGLAIFNGIKNHPARVVARVEGLAASMGSVILMAADEVEIPENAYIMIHNVSGGAYGDIEELESMTSLMRKLQDDVTDLYANATGRDKEEIRDLMDKETWMNGEDAVKHGFATRVLEPVKAAACADLETLVAKFENVPASVLELQAEEPAEEETQVEEIEDSLEEEQAQESDDQESAEADQEEIEKELQDEVKAKAELSTWGRILAALSGDKSAENDGGSSAKAALQRAEKLEAELSGRVDELEKIQDELEILRAENKELESCALTVESRLIECGFDFAEASDLPAPNANKIGNVLETYLAMQPGQDRREFFAKNRKEIERLQSE